MPYKLIFADALSILNTVWLTSLGLAICKAIMENMGGEIGVESRLGSASTVYIICPLLLSGMRCRRGRPTSH